MISFFKALSASSIVVASLALNSPAAYAQQTARQVNPQIDYDGFLELTKQLKSVRESRRISADRFFAMAQEDGAIILDTRSVDAFRLGHIKGAVNLPFSDFTQDKLERVLGDNKDRPILIYCNNNFRDNIPPIALKSAPLALNIPTFINLYGYGYQNVWELADIVSVKDIDWEHSILLQPRN